MVDNNALRSKILDKLSDWLHLDCALKEDTFIDVDLINRTVSFIDADDLIKLDLEDSDDRLSFYTIYPWEFAEYDEGTDALSLPMDEVEAVINEAVELCDEFSDVYEEEDSTASE